MQMDGKWTASNVEFQQMRDQYLRKQQLSMGINNPGQVPLGNVMQQSQQSQPQPQQHNQQLPNLSQQQAVLGKLVVWTLRRPEYFGCLHGYFR